MTAIIANAGLGLFDATRNPLSESPINTTTIGQSAVGLNFNVATGNLVVWDGDHTRVGQGADSRFGRTYNSLGHAGDADGWRFNFERELLIGSSITRITGDEHRSEFTSIGSNTYQSTDGSGAHDTITFNGSNTYTYTEGTTGATETYQQFGGRWLLVSSKDKSGQGQTYSYDGQNRLSRVTQDNGEYTLIKYDGANRVSSFESYVKDSSSGSLYRQGTAVHYEYDAYGRLSKAKVDLTAQDNSIADGNVYETVYTYHGTGLLVKDITQTDGSQVSFTYFADNRLKTYEVGSGSDGTKQLFNFSYSSNQVNVTDASGSAWTYQYDANDRLTHVYSPAQSGQRKTAEFAYDANGNLLKSIDGENRTVDYRYDSNGNLTHQIDSEGNRIVRTYTATNQLKSETLYTSTFNAANIDSLSGPDLSLASTNAAELTSHYIYDSSDRLRFVISADKKVTEYRYENSNELRKVSAELRYEKHYDGASTASLSSLTAWRDNAGHDKSGIARTHFWYDFRGQLSQQSTYANVNASGNPISDNGMSRTDYVYDAFGNLLNEIRFHGNNRSLQSTTTYAYDGANRLTSTIDALNKTSSMSYLGNQVITTATNGLTSTQTFNSQGLLTSSANATTSGPSETRASQLYYDTQGRLVAAKNDLGGVSYNIYNKRGQLTYIIDETGAVIQNTYDDSGRVVSTKHYVKRIDTTSWYNSNLNHTTHQATALEIASKLSVDATHDRVSQTIYDEAGRIDHTIDGEGHYTYFFYDGASRLIKTESRDGNSTTDARIARFFFNEDGQQIGSLDAEGYVTETKYNGRGLVTETIVYATQSAAGLRATGSLAQLISVDATKDQHSYLYYDSHNRKKLTINAEGQVTYTKYLESGDKVETIQYAKVYTGSTSASVASIVAAVDDSNKRVSAVYLDRLGRVDREINYEGTESKYHYNNADQVIQVTIAEGETDIHGNSETRTSRTRYNQFGEVTGEVLDSSHGSISDSALDSLIAAQGVTKRYDVLGRLAETIDAEGNQQFYFYDQASRLTHVVNGDGEVTETSFNAFGEVSETKGYAGTIDVASLAGGQVTSALISRINSVTSAVRDAIVSNTYDNNGRLIGASNTAGKLTNLELNAWGEMVKQTVSATDNSINTAITQFDYNKRGELTQTTDALGNVAKSEFDAFGRVTQVIDPLGNVTTYEYDKLGREVVITDPLGGQVLTTYDAFNRTLTTTDKLGNQTSYVYDDNNQTTTIVFADGSTSSSKHNRLGETIETTDGLNNVTKFTFNHKGELTHVTDALGHVTESQFDKTGRLATSIDANGIKTTYVYDQAGRVLTQTQDAEGLQRATRYQYDGLGNTLVITDPAGHQTRYVYDGSGNVRFIVDAEGYVTENVYDANGNVVNTKRYTNIDLNSLFTESTYLSAGNEVSNIEVYDATPAGATINRVYDSEKQHDVVQFVGSGTSNGYRVKSDGLTNWNNTSQRSLSWDMKYSEGYTIYISVDTTKGHRYLTYTAGDREPSINTSGYAFFGLPIETRNGSWQNISRDLAADLMVVEPDNEIIDVNAFLIRGSGFIDDIKLTGELSEQELTRVINGEQPDAVEYSYRYDELGRVRYTLDGEGYVSENLYDAAGNLYETRRYNQSISTLDDIAKLPQRVEWQGANNVAIDGNTITKTTGNGSWNAGAYSTQSITDGTGSATFTISTPTSRMMLGFSKGTNAGASYTEIDHAIYVTGTLIYVYENGSNKGRASVDHQAGNEYRVLLKDSKAFYQVKSQSDESFQTFYTSTLAVDSNATYFVDSSIVYDNDRIENVFVSDDVDNDYSSMRYVYDALGQNRFVIDSEGYVTEQRYDANGNVIETVRYDDKFNSATAQLSSRVTWDNVSTPIEVSNGSLAMPSKSDSSWHGAKGSEVIRGEGYVEFSFPTLNKRAMVGLNTANSTGSYTDLDYAFYNYTDNTIRVYEEGSHKLQLSIPQKVGNRYRIEINAGVAKYYVKEEGSSQFTLVYTSSRAVDNGKDYFVDSSLYDVGVKISDIELNGVALTKQQSSAVVTQYVYDELGRVRYTLDGESYVSENLYDAAGNLAETRRYNQSISTLDDIAKLPQRVEWQGANNVAIDGNTITKTTGNGSWNAGAYSTQSITDGTGSATFTISTPTSRMMLGFSKGTNAGASYTEIDHAIYVTGTLIYVYENGSNKGRASVDHQAGNEYRVLLKDGKAFYQVKSQSDESFQTFYTSTLAVDSNATYFVDSSIVYDNDRIENVFVSDDVDNDYSSMRYVYDALGQNRFVIDSEGYVTEQRYDANGNVIETVRYDEKFNSATAQLSSRVTWDNVSTPIEVSNGSLAMPSKSDSSWHGAKGSEVIRGEGYVEFSFPTLNKRAMVGLNTANSTGSYTDLDYAFYNYTDNTIRVYEEGTHKLQLSIPQKIGNRYRIEIDAGVAKYYVKEEGSSQFTLVYTSSRAVDNGKDYFVDSSLYDVGVQISDIELNGVALTKQQSSAVATQYVYDSLGRVRFTVDGEGFVVESKYDQSNNLIESISYDTPLSSSGPYRESEMMKLIGGYVSWQGLTDKTDHDGLTLTKNSTVNGWDAAANSKEVLIDGKGFVEFKVKRTDGYQMVGLTKGDSTRTDFRDIDYAIYITNSTLRVYENGTNKDYLTGFSHSANNVYRVLLENGQAHYQVKQVNDSDFVTMRTSTVAVDSNAVYRADVSMYDGEGSVSEVKLARGDFDSQSIRYIYNKAGQARYTIDGEGFVTESKFDSRGNVVESLRYDVPLEPGGHYTETELSHLIGGYVTWQGFTNKTDHNGLTLNKNASVNGWDAAANSKEVLTEGKGFVEFKVKRTDGYQMIGLTKGDSTRTDFQDIDYAIYITNSTLRVYENGANKDYLTGFSHAATNVYRVLLDNGQAHYQVKRLSDNDFVTMRTSSVTVDNTAVYRADISMYDGEGSVSDVKLARGSFNSQSTQFVYDDLGQVRFTIDAEGYVTESIYNSQGNVTKLREYQEPIDAGADYNLQQLSTMLSTDLNLISHANVAVDGNTVEKIAGSGSSYDAAAYSSQAIVNGEGAIRFKVPSLSSRVLVGLNNNGSNSTSYTDMEYSLFIYTNDITVYENGSNKGSFVNVHEAGTEYRILMANGGVQYQSRKTGETEFTTFYTSTLTPDTNASYVADTTLMHMGDRVTDLTIDGSQVSSSVRETQFIYNSLGQQKYSIDASGYVSENIYDARGNVVEFRQFDQPIHDLKQLENLPKAINWQGAVNVSTENNSITKTSGNGSWNAGAYSQESITDGNGSVSFTIDSATTRMMLGFSKGTNAGSSYSEIDYAIYITSTTIQIYENGSLRNTASHYHMAGNQYRVLMQNGTAYYQIKAGNKSNFETFYTSTLAVDNNATYFVDSSLVYDGNKISDVVLSDNAAIDWKSTKFDFDKRGQLTSTTDANNNTEKYTYDAFGNRITFTNKKNDTWNYKFDKRGNLIEEISPQVSVASNGGSATTQAITKRFAYDGFGNVLSITGAYGIVGQERTTQYEYDKRGYQLKTTYSDQGIYSAGSSSVVATGSRSQDTTWYNAFGQAVKNQNTEGYYQYKSYNANGQLEYEIDGEGFVTYRQYNHQGQVTQLTRYANALSTSNLTMLNNLGSQFTSADIKNKIVVNSSKDRSITTEYNRLGQQVSVKQASIASYKSSNKSSYTTSPETQYAYDAFGRVIKQSTKVDNTTWAHVYTYYNELGQVSATVDALGYLTTLKYDAFGNLAEQTEFATKLSGSWNENSQPTVGTNSKDRITRFEYDAMNRLTTTTRVNVRVSRIDAGGLLTSTQNVSESIAYDALGRQTTTIDANGNSATTTYDKLGRVKSVQDVSRAVAKNGELDSFLAGKTVNVTPTTSYAYNAHGELITTTQSSGNASAKGATTVTQNVVDFHGNIVKSVNALGHATINKYNSQGAIVETRQSVDQEELVSYQKIIGYEEEYDYEHRRWIRWPIYQYVSNEESPESYKFTRIQKYEYDSNGQQIKTSINTNYANEAERFITTVTGYNAFGEIVNQGLQGQENTFTFSYDKAGRLTSTNQGDGVAKEYLYDLTGQMTRQRLVGSTSTSSDDRYTYVIYDLNGNAIEQQAPSFTAFSNSANSSTGTLKTPTVKQSYDRWGNVTKFTNAANLVTDYEFDHGNRLVKETKAATDYWNASGQKVSGFRAVSEQFYDELGQRIGEKDAAGYEAKFVYNAAGQLTASYDRFGYQTEYAYDAFGRQVAKKDALGYIRTTHYDLIGQTVKQGIVRRSGSNGYKSGQDPSTNLYETILNSFDYDELGQRMIDYKGDKDLASSSYISQYKYDTRGNIVLTTQMRQKNLVNDPNLPERRTYATFDDYGNKNSQTDAMGYTSTWTYNAYGKVQDYVNIGGKRTDYIYNGQGELIREEYEKDPGFSKTERRYDYWQNGMLKSITDERLRGTRGAAFDGSDRSDNYYLDLDVDYFEYDVLGHQVLSRTTNKTEEADSYTTGGGGGGGGDPIEPPFIPPEDPFDPLQPFNIQSLETQSMTTQSYNVVKLVRTNTFNHETRSQYDALDRVTLIKSPNNNGSNRINSLEKRYDERGNIRATVANYRVSGSSYDSNYSNWHTYDAENRLLTVRGTLQGSTIKPYEVATYDAIGQRVTSTTSRGTYRRVVEEEFGMQTIYQDIEAFKQTRFIYDDIGNLEDTQIRVKAEFKSAFGQGASTQYGSWLYKTDQTIDDWGRTTNQINYKENWRVTYTDFSRFTSDSSVLSQILNTKRESRTVTYYNTINQATSQTNYEYDANGVNSYRTNTISFANGYDLAGNQRWYNVSVYKNNGSTFDYSIKYTTEYDLYDGYKMKRQTATHSRNTSNPGETIYTYDYRGNLQKVVQQDAEDPNQSFTRLYTTNRNGQIINQKEGTKNQSFYYVNGTGVADIGNLSGVDFNYNQKAFSQQVKQASPSQYVVNNGDSLKSIAAAVYGDASLWYVIADRNGIASDSELVSGMSLNIPPQLTNTNNADTFRPYNPGDIIGDTSPIAIAPPPPDPGCNALAAIIIVVVVIIVTVYSAGAASGAAIEGTAAAGNAIAGTTVTAANAAAGATAAIGTPVAASTWAAGTAALTGSYGLGTAMAAGLVGGMAGNAAGQVAGNALGVRDGYSLREMFASGLTSMATAGISHGLSNSSSSLITEGKKLTAGGKAIAAATGVIASAAANKLVGLPSGFRWSNVASSMAASYLGAKLGLTADGTKETLFENEGLWSQTFSGIASSAISHAVKKGFFNEGKWDFKSVAANAFGSALGNALVGEFDYISKTDASERKLLRGLNIEEKDYYFKQRSLFTSAGVLDRLEAKQLAKDVLTDLIDRGTEEERLDLLKRVVLGVGGTEEEAAEVVKSDLIQNVVYGTEDAMDNINGMVGSFFQTGEHSYLRTSSREFGTNPGEYLNKKSNGGGDEEFLAGLVESASPVLLPVGEGIESLSKKLDSPLAKFTITALEVAGGPVKFAIGKAIENSFIGDYINNQIGKAHEEFTTYVAENSNLTKEEASKSGGGALGLLTIALTAAAMFRNLPEISASMEKMRLKDGNFKLIKRLQKHEISFDPFSNKKFQSMTPKQKKVFLKEYADQLEAQQKALNSMTAKEFKAARDAFEKHGRNPTADSLQRKMGRDLEKDIRDNLRKELEAKGISPKEAKKIATARAKELKSHLAALHEPDMIMGGYHNPAPKRMGLGSVNSSIGATWRGQIDKVDAFINNAIKSGHGDGYLNFQLQMPRGAGG